MAAIFTFFRSFPNAGRGLSIEKNVSCFTVACYQILNCFVFIEIDTLFCKQPKILKPQVCCYKLSNKCLVILCTWWIQGVVSSLVTFKINKNIVILKREVLFLWMCSHVSDLYLHQALSYINNHFLVTR